MSPAAGATAFIRDVFCESPRVRGLLRRVEAAFSPGGERVGP